MVEHHQEVADDEMCIFVERLALAHVPILVLVPIGMPQFLDVCKRMKEMLHWLIN